MNEQTKLLLKIYNPENFIKPILEQCDPRTIKGGSFVVIDAKALKNKTIATELVARRGIEFYKNLEVLARTKQTMLVSALKIVKPTSAYISETSPNNFEEADLVVQKVPGLYNSPITVPTSILKTVAGSCDIYGHPIPDEFNQKTEIVKTANMDNEYNNGKQPRGTRANGGNN